MSSIDRSAAAPVLPVTFAATACEAAALALDDLLGRGMRGSASALHAASYELRGHLIMEVWPILEDVGCEQDAEDVADDVLLAVLEGHVRARRGPGEALAAVMRHARQLADDHVEDTRKRWGLELDE
jgi:DNA-directed RNA polymerase specialized sigma24 family protein